MATGNTATSNFFFEKRPWGELMDSMRRVTPAIDKTPATTVAGDASAGALYPPQRTHAIGALVRARNTAWCILSEGCHAPVRTHGCVTVVIWRACDVVTSMDTPARV